MKKRAHATGATTTFIIFAIVASMAILPTLAQGADETSSMMENPTAATQIPEPRLVGKIDLSHIGSVVAIRKLSFSPDSRYLGIVVDPELGKTDIVVWDMEKGKPQSHIHCPYQYGILADHDLLWSRDGKVISFGAKRQWNPMTGEALPDNPAIGRAARLNKDGTKMLTIVGALGQPSYIYVYDTQTWDVQKIYLDGFFPISANWTASNKIFIGANLSHELYLRKTDGYQAKNPYDHAYRLLDPSGKNAPKTLWFPAKETGDLKKPFAYSSDVGTVVNINPASNQILLSSGIIINGDTLAIDRTHQSFFQHIFDAEFGFLISNDGKKMYTKGALFKYGGHNPTPNRIIDLSTKKVVAEFGGLIDDGDGFSLSNNGKNLAIGNASVIQLYQVQ